MVMIRESLPAGLFMDIGRSKGNRPARHSGICLMTRLVGSQVTISLTQNWSLCCIRVVSHQDQAYEYVEQTLLYNLETNTTGCVACRVITRGLKIWGWSSRNVLHNASVHLRSELQKTHGLPILGMCYRRPFRLPRSGWLNLLALAWLLGLLECSGCQLRVI